MTSLYVQPVYRNAYRPPFTIFGDNILPDPQKSDRFRMHVNSKLSHTACVVRGALSLVLRASRLVGVAPLRMTHQCKNGQNALVVSYSENAALYGWLLMLVLHGGLLSGLAIDLTLDRPQSIRTRASIALVAWVLELFIVTSVVTTAVCGAPARVKQMIDWFNVIERVRGKPANNQAQKRVEMKQCLFIVALLTAMNLVSAGDFGALLIEAFNEDRAWRVMCIYSCFYIEFLIVVVIELQFIFVALHLQVALGSVNDCLSDLVYIVGLQHLDKNSVEEADPIFIKRINYGVDTEGKSKSTAHNRTKKAEDSLYRIMESYSTICDVIMKVNKSYERVLIFLVASCFLHLVITPYYFVSYLHSKKIKIFELCLQVGYLILHPLFLIIIVEPGHRTDRELNRTSTLVSQLLRRTPARGPLTVEIDLFYKQLHLNKAQYSPMGLCTLTRPFIASICGGVTTYLVIILQFQSLESSLW